MGNGPSNFVNHSPAEAILTGLDKNTHSITSTFTNGIKELLVGLLVLILFFVAAGAACWYWRKRRAKRRRLTKYQIRFLNDFSRSARLNQTPIPVASKRETWPQKTRSVSPPPYTANYVNVNDYDEAESAPTFRRY
ncbi:p14 protein [Reptilian orthoreovirus]|uniref:P14 protein n=1 Tax=chelonian orthoreovirus TaxID=3071237 RepID=A0A1D7PVH9_9REOV|nr:p14 protein [Reptilian orthoreovirus]AOM63690.1 p14 protein [chelonian orthoreovirus]